MDSWIYILFALLLFPVIFRISRSISQMSEPERDIEGAKEDGYLQRYPGSVIEFYREEEDIHRIVIKMPEYPAAGEPPLFEYFDVSGIRKTVLYKVPVIRSPETVYKYYMKEMKEAGFEIIYTGRGEKDLGNPEDWYRQVIVTGKNITAWAELSNILQGKLLCYFSGMKNDVREKIYLSVFAVNHFRNDRKTGIFIFVSKQ